MHGLRFSWKLASEDPTAKGFDVGQTAYEVRVSCNANHRSPTLIDTGVVTTTHTRHTVRDCAQAAAGHALPHTVTHCHALSHTVTHCHALSHTAKRYHALSHTATHCHVLSHTAKHCHALWQLLLPNVSLRAHATC
jgi:hypothetical protein